MAPSPGSVRNNGLKIQGTSWGGSSRALFSALDLSPGDDYLNSSMKKLSIAFQGEDIFFIGLWRAGKYNLEIR
jgi:hypothetical protein